MGALRDWRHEKFAADYVERSLKGECTARDSAFAAAGYAASKATARRLKNRPEVKARIQELFERAAEFANVNRPRIVVELDRVGRGDVANFVESVPTASGGFELRLKDITKPPPAVTRLDERDCPWTTRRSPESRAWRPRRAPNVPLVALTGWGQEKERNRTAEARFDKHLAKPVREDVLQALLAERR